MGEGTASGYRAGQQVFVKPPAAKCTSQWPLGTVTGINNSLSVEVDGLPRHVADLRPAPDIAQTDTATASPTVADSGGARSVGTPDAVPAQHDWQSVPGERTSTPRQPRRAVTLPRRFEDFVLDQC